MDPEEGVVRLGRSLRSAGPGHGVLDSRVSETRPKPPFLLVGHAPAKMTTMDGLEEVYMPEGIRVR